VKVKIIKKIIDWGSGETNAFCFLPENKISTVAILTHGYTSHKGAVLPWALKLAQIGIPSIIFDLPGHYLGSFGEVLKFEDFSQKSHKIFFHSLESFRDDLNFSSKFKIVLGGHSLGSLLALKAIDSFKDHEILCICVGHGLTQPGESMVFDSPFFKETMHIREQLISPVISPSYMFPWIQKEQQHLSLSNQKIILIWGRDDLVISEKSVLNLKEQLEKGNNSVFLEIANRLPHNNPELASSLIRKLVKEHGFA
jgi:hypothetical protein